MNIKSRLISALMAALFLSAVMFTGTAMAKHCDHEPEPVDIWSDYDE